MRSMRALGICGLLLVSGCAGANRGTGVEPETRSRLLQFPRPWSGSPLNAPRGVSGPEDWAPSVAMAGQPGLGGPVGPDRPFPLRRPDPDRRSQSGAVALATWEGRAPEPEDPRIPVLPVALHIEALPADDHRPPLEALAEAAGNQDNPALLVRTDAGSNSAPETLPRPTSRPAPLPGPVEASEPAPAPLPPGLMLDRPSYDVKPRQPSPAPAPAPARGARPAPAALPGPIEAGPETPAPQPPRRSIPLTIEEPPVDRRPRASLPAPAEATAATSQPGRAALPGALEADQTLPPTRLSLRPAPRPRVNAPPPVTTTTPRRPCPHCEPSLDPNAPPRDLRPTASAFPDAPPQPQPRRTTWRPRFFRLWRGDQDSSTLAR